MAMMARPIIPQTRIRFVGESRPRVQPSQGETVAVLIEHDSGPLLTELEKPEILTSFDEFVDRYGDSDTAGRTAVAGAFQGQGVRGAGGAGAVIPLRMATGTAARASVTLDNTAAADAVTLTAKWAGTRPNDYTVQIDADPSNAANDRLRIRYKGAVVETHTYPRTTLDQLVTTINSEDNGHVTATLVLNGVALALTASTNLSSGTAGSNGAALTATQYLDALDVLEFQPFTLLAAANLTDGGTQASILSWIRAQEEANRPVMWVVGGAAGETISTAVTRSTTLADPHVVNIGVGTYHDDLLDKDLSTAQLAPRIAGIIAARGKSKALTGAELGGLHAIGMTGATTTDAETAIARGVTVLIRTDSDEADLRVAMGLTTFTSSSDAARPRQIFSEPRFIRIMDLFVRDMKRWGDKHIIGNVPVNQDSRDAVRAQGSKLINELLLDGLILTKVGGADADPFIRTPVTVDDTLPFEFGWQFSYTANFLLGEGRVR